MPPITMTRNSDVAWGLRLDGEDLVLRVGEVTPAQASALRQQSHGAWRLPTLLEAVSEGIGPEEIVGLVFLARRQAGEHVTYDAVADQVAAATEVVLDFGAEPAEDDSPEA